MLRVVMMSATVVGAASGAMAAADYYEAWSHQRMEATRDRLGAEIDRRSAQRLQYGELFPPCAEFARLNRALERYAQIAGTAYTPPVSGEACREHGID